MKIILFLLLISAIFISADWIDDVVTKRIISKIDKSEPFGKETQSTHPANFKLSNIISRPANNTFESPTFAAKVSNRPCKVRVHLATESECIYKLIEEYYAIKTYSNTAFVHLSLKAEIGDKNIVYLAIGEDVEGYSIRLPRLSPDSLEGARVIDVKNGIADEISHRLKGFNLGAQIPSLDSQYVAYLATISTVEYTEQHLERTDAIIKIRFYTSPRNSFFDSAVNNLFSTEPDRLFRYSSDAFINGRRAQILAIQLFPFDDIYPSPNIDLPLIFIEYARLVSKKVENIKNAVDNNDKAISLRPFTLSNYIHSTETYAFWGAFKAEITLKAKSSKPKAVYVRVQLLEHGSTDNYLYREYKERRKLNENDFLCFSPMATINGKNVAFLIYQRGNDDSNEERLKIIVPMVKRKDLVDKIVVHGEADPNEPPEFGPHLHDFKLRRNLFYKKNLYYSTFYADLPAFKNRVVVKVTLLHECNPYKLIEDYYKIKSTYRSTYVHLCLKAKLLNYEIAYLIINDVHIDEKTELNPLKPIPFEDLPGKIVLYHVKPSNEASHDQLMSFKIGTSVPVSGGQSKRGWGAYIATVQTPEHTTIDALVIIMFDLKPNTVLETEYDHLKSDKPDRWVYLGKNALMEGHRISFLAVNINGGNFEKSSIAGLESEFILYTYFNGKQIIQKDKPMIDHGDQNVDFLPFTLEDYKQNKDTHWGSFLSEISLASNPSQSQKVFVRLQVNLLNPKRVNSKLFKEFQYRKGQKKRNPLYCSVAKVGDFDVEVLVFNRHDRDTEDRLAKFR